MTTLGGEDPPGASPLEDEDLEGLIPTFVATRSDLNIVEQANIERATLWAYGARPRTPIADLLSVTFAFELHRRMFADVWRWAGQPRPRETNIGVAPVQIATAMKLAFDDAMFWHDRETYTPPERAVRLHHRLVQVHPFRNGNGRHSRLMADVYLYEIGVERLPWGAGDNLVINSDVRKAYISALHDADGGDVGPLLRFALR
jgi:Fic-DOC domain mobile mystery protein B